MQPVHEPDFDGPLERQLDADPALACEISYRQTTAALAIGTPDVEMGDFPPLFLAPHDIFMDDCLKMPAQLQKCQVFSYGLAHRKFCNAARQDYNLALQDGTR